MQSKNRLSYILLAYFSLFCSGLMDNIRGPAYPDILTCFGVTMSVGSLFFAVASFTGLPVIVFGRLWIAYVGEVRGQLISILLMGIGFLGVGLSGYLYNGYTEFIISAAVFGAGLGATSFTTNVLIAMGTNEGNRRRFFSGLHSMYGLASVIAPTMYALAIENSIGWQKVFIFLAATPLLIIIFFCRTKNLPRTRGVAQKVSRIPLKSTTILGLMMGFYAASEIAISSRLVLFIERTMSISVADATIYLSAFFALLLAGRFLFFAIPFPWSTKKWMYASAIVSLACSVAGVLWSPVFLPVCGLTMSIYFPLGMDEISKRFEGRADEVISFVMAYVNIALIFMHWGIGALADHVGVKFAMLLSPALLVATITMMIVSGKVMGGNRIPKNS